MSKIDEMNGTGFESFLAGRIKKSVAENDTISIDDLLDWDDDVEFSDLEKTKHDVFESIGKRHENFMKEFAEAQKRMEKFHDEFEKTQAEIDEMLASLGV